MHARTYSLKQKTGNREPEDDVLFGSFTRRLAEVTRAELRPYRGTRPIVTRRRPDDVFAGGTTVPYRVIRFSVYRRRTPTDYICISPGIQFAKVYSIPRTRIILYYYFDSRTSMLPVSVFYHWSCGKTSSARARDL